MKCTSISPAVFSTLFISTLATAVVTTTTDDHLSTNPRIELVTRAAEWATGYTLVCYSADFYKVVHPCPKNNGISGSYCVNHCTCDSSGTIQCNKKNSDCSVTMVESVCRTPNDIFYCSCNETD